LALAFVLGMRHALDADHVVAVSAMVSRHKTWRAAAPIGAVWGLGHTLTIVTVGVAIVLFGLAIPTRVSLAMELAVACMLVVLGALNMRRPRKDAAPSARFARPLVVGLIHGLAGSAGVVLLVVAATREPVVALGHLVIFCVGTACGMALVTVAMTAPLLATAKFEAMHRWLGVGAGALSIAFGIALGWKIGVTDGLFF
jgi:high-affinity nickel-transport protein